MKKVNSGIQLSASDLVNFLGCQHLTELDRSVALGDLDKPTWNNPAIAILHKKGLDHETEYLEFLKGLGLRIIDLSERYSLDATKAAMAEGFDVIFQAPLSTGNWFGIADFLIKVEGESQIGNYQYEVQDTKLSRETKAGTVLQLCLYSQIVGELQGVHSENMKVVKPNPSGGFEFDTFRFDEFQSYYHFIKERFEKVIADQPKQTYPLPVSRCDICRWWKHCDRKWHDDDHLTLIAGLRSTQLRELEVQEFSTLEQYAKNDRPTNRKPEKGNEASFIKLHGQAGIQLKGRENDQLEFELLPVAELRGLNRLPEPSDGDIFFDIEGDHFYENGGLEYLLGWSFREPDGSFSYGKQWALNRLDERVAFEKFIGMLMDQWNRYPDFHVYHYAPYEPSAMKRLASRHGTMENEVDKLLRAERFIDLHTVIKESLQASVESYSLKQMEAFTDYKRQADLFEAAAARRKLGLLLDLKKPDSIDPSDLDLIQEYNKDDCLATEGLQRWLESVYQNALKEGRELSRPELKSGDASEKVDEMDMRSRELYDGLVSGLPDDRDNWNEINQANWLLANMIDFFRRENRVAWWEFFRLHELEDDELLDEKDGVAYLEFFEEYKKGKERNPTHRYRFPAQEVSSKISSGAKVTELQGGKVGAVRKISIEEGWVDIQKTKEYSDVHPTSVHIGDPIPNGLLGSALHAFAKNIIEFGIEDRDFYSAGKDLLLKRPPRLKDENPISRDEEQPIDSAIRMASELDSSFLAIQGPPGTGKTYTGASMIVELFRQDKRIGVTAVSHKVIRNLIDKTIEIGNKENVTISAAHKTSDESDNLPDGLVEISGNKEAFEALAKGKILGGTSWLWTREEAEGQLDYLFVDEAGQMSLANVLACSRAAKNIVLLGDPQQLEQPQQGAHPEGTEISALNHILDGHKTMPEEKGLFLNITWRLPPEITRFTSEQFYENRLVSKPELERQKIYGESKITGSGLFFLPVEHKGNQNTSIEEVEAIGVIAKEIVNSGLKWQNLDGDEFPIALEDVLIVAPYNAQVSAIKNRLPDFRVGTVDKFQGQEAPIVIYSMTSSSPDDAPRGMAFLYDPHRLNVATSRAQCVSLLVASPKLFEPDCHSVDQMKWANGLCRYKELSSEIGPPN